MGFADKDILIVGFTNKENHVVGFTQKEIPILVDALLHLYTNRCAKSRVRKRG